MKNLKSDILFCFKAIKYMLNVILTITT